MKIKYKIKNRLRIINMEPRRYKNLLKICYKHRCKTIMEIGTWNGQHAVQLIETAKIFYNKEEIYYYGFDLFEDFSDSDLENEFSKKPPKQADVKKKLEKTGVNVRLTKGYSRYTLPIFIDEIKTNNLDIDLVFIDGGHSIETITSDWNYVKKIINHNSIVIFDDYYRNQEEIINKYGCTSLIDRLDPNIYSVEILKPEDHFNKDWGILNVSMVKIGLKKV